LPALVLLRKALIRAAKRRKQPERYATFIPIFFYKFDVVNFESFQ
jgi:hypothetical protein